MDDMNIDLCIIWVITTLMVFSNTIKCAPIASSEDLEKSETRLPNGTIIGKYKYLDRLGNPVQIKYYADDSGYGVELQSVKIAESLPDSGSLKNAFSSEDPAYHTLTSDIIKPFNMDIPQTSTKDSSSPDFLGTNTQEQDFFKQLVKKGGPFKKSPVRHKSQEYEVLEDSISFDVPANCGKNKVQIYAPSKNKNREYRNIVKKESSNNIYEKYCDKF